MRLHKERIEGAHRLTAYGGAYLFFLDRLDGRIRWVYKRRKEVDPSIVTHGAGKNLLHAARAVQANHRLRQHHASANP